MAQVIAKIPNAVQRESFLLEVARRLQVSRSVLEQEVRKAESAQRRTELMARGTAGGQNEGAAENDAAETEPLEVAKTIEELLALLLTHPELVPEVSRVFLPAWIEGLGGAEVLLKLLDAHAHEAFEDAPHFLQECDERTRNYLSGLLFSPPPAPTETALDLYARQLVAEMEKRWKRQRMAVLEQEVKSNLFSGAELSAKMAELMRLRKPAA
jgi:hypothetical protein